MCECLGGCARVGSRSARDMGPSCQHMSKCHVLRRSSRQLYSVDSINIRVAIGEDMNPQSSHECTIVCLFFK